MVAKAIINNQLLQKTINKVSKFFMPLKSM